MCQSVTRARERTPHGYRRETIYSQVIVEWLVVPFILPITFQEEVLDVSHTTFHDANSASKHLLLMYNAT